MRIPVLLSALLLSAGADMRAAVQAAVSALPSRTSKQNVLVRGSGTISAGARISLPSHTLIDVCGTINVTGSGSGDYAPLYTRGTTDVEIAHLDVTGTPLYGIFARSVDNLTLGVIDMRLTSGLGVRIDNYGNTAVMAKSIKIGSVYVSGASSHAVETYGVDGITIGTVTARGVGESGPLLNQTINATGGGEVRILSRTEFAPSSNITFKNLTVTNTGIRWSPCTGANNVVTNVTRVNSTLTWC